jgi:hypothetical protein
MEGPGGFWNWACGGRRFWRGYPVVGRYSNHLPQRSSRLLDRSPPEEPPFKPLPQFVTFRWLVAGHVLHAPQSHIECERYGKSCWSEDVT